MSEIRKVHITCPTCQNTYDIDVPFTTFDKSQLEKGLVTLSLRTACGHACYVFIDKNFKMRGGQCADYEIDAGNATAVPLTNAQFQATELLLKYAAEIIKMDVQDEAFIKSIGAEDKMEAMENALIHGDVKKAGSIIDNLRRFASEIDEKEFADKLLKKIKNLNNLIINNPNLDWGSLVLKDKEAKNETEYASLRAIHYDRVRKIIAELEFEAIEERLPRAAVDAKKQRLVDRMDEE
jgi:hypothetical protein